MKYLIIYLILINIISLFAYKIDKKKAEKGKWRIKETTLLAFALFGGGIGSIIGMNRFHHKTKKHKFRIGVPLLTIVSIAIMWFIITEFNL